MEKRTELLLTLRPQLDLQPAAGAIEIFQNETLRPILKFQNALLLDICRAQFIKRKSVFFKLATEERLSYIEQQIHQDHKFKHLLWGCIIGHLTIEEWPFFLDHENELKRRITSMLIQRIQSQVSTI